MTTKIAEAKNKYNKRIEDLIEDAEIEAEIEAEKKVRSKHTKLFLISAIGLGLLVFLYLGISMRSEEQPASAKTEVAQNTIIPSPDGTPAPTAYIPEPKPIPFPIENKEQSAALSEEKVKPAHRELPPVPTSTRELTKNAPKNQKPSDPESLKTVDEKQNPAVVESGLLVLPDKETPKSETPLKSKSATPRISANQNNDPGKEPKAVKKSVSNKQHDKPKHPDPANVKAVAKPAPKEVKKEGYFVQVGVFSVQNNADVLANKLKAKGLRPVIDSKHSQSRAYSVFVGEFADKKNSDEPMKSLQKSGFKPKLEKITDNTYTLAVGEFKAKKDAEGLQDKLSNKGFMSGIRQKNTTDAGSFVVHLGNFSTEQKARVAQEQTEQLGFKGAFIRKEG